MPINENTLRAYIGVAIKRTSKPLRKAFSSSSWLEREEAERAIAAAVIEALKGFDIE